MHECTHRHIHRGKILPWNSGDQNQRLTDIVMNDRREECWDTGISVMWLMELEHSAAQKGNGISVHISTYMHLLCVTSYSFKHFSKVHTAHLMFVCEHVCNPPDTILSKMPKKRAYHKPNAASSHPSRAGEQYESLLSSCLNPASLQGRWMVSSMPVRKVWSRMTEKSSKALVLKFRTCSLILLSTYKSYHDDN